MGKFTKKYEPSRIFQTTLFDGTEIVLKNYPNKFQKRLLAASISENKDMIYEEIIQVLNESIVKPENFDLKNVPYFDVHKLFITLVSNSYQNKFQVAIDCKNEIKKEDNEDNNETEVCDESVNTVIDLDKMIVENLENLIYTNQDFDIKFRYPNFKEYSIFLEKLQIIDPSEKFIAIAELIQECIYSIIDEDDEMLYSELDDEDKQFIIDSISPSLLNRAVTDLIKPYINIVIPFVCPKCGHKKKVELKGIDNFFR